MTNIDSTEFFYEGYEVQVLTTHLASGEWGVDVRISGSRKDNRGEWTRHWLLADTFQMKDEALSYGSAWGKKLIDGGVEEPSNQWC